MAEVYALEDALTGVPPLARPAEVESWRRRDALPPSLVAAHEYLTARPRAEARRDELIAFHEYQAQVYRHVASIDTRHKHEALANAWLEKDKADELRAPRRKRP